MLHGMLSHQEEADGHESERNVRRMMRCFPQTQAHALKCNIKRERVRLKGQGWTPACGTRTWATPTMRRRGGHEELALR
jgi:hypothetical protein